MQINKVQKMLDELKQNQEIEPALPIISQMEEILQDQEADSKREDLMALARDVISVLVESLDFEKIPETNYCIDIHTHAKFTLPAKTMRTEDCRAMIEVGRRKGLNALAFTDHMGYLNFFKDLGMIKEIAKDYPDFTVLTGGEVNIVEPRKSADVSGGGDVLVIGEPEILRRFNNLFHNKFKESLINSNYSPAFDDLMQAIAIVKEESGLESVLAIPAHLYRRRQELYDLESGRQNVNLDSPEIVGFDCPVKDFGYVEQTNCLAREKGLPVFYSSDAHTALEVGSLYTVLDCSGEKKLSLEEVRSYLAQGKVLEPAAVFKGQVDDKVEGIRKMGVCLKEVMVEVSGLHRPEID